MAKKLIRKKKSVKRPVRIKPIPLSSAKNALELVQEVKAHILAEPLRVDMGITTDKRESKDNGPACGTVGCFAGWIALLSGKITQKEVLTGADGDKDAITEAENLLGADIHYDLPADNDNHYGYVEAFDSGHDIAHYGVGTKAYAEAVGRRIDRFIDRNRAALKARKLNVRTVTALVPVE